MQQEFDPSAQVTLAVLAGGEGSRMGVPKGSLLIGGEPILRYLVRRFEWPGPTLLVTAPGREHPSGWESFSREVTDPIGGLGPLRGILTALETAGTQHVIVTPLDMPGLAASHLRWLALAFDMRRSSQRDLIGMMMFRETSQGAGSTPGGPARRIEPFPAAFHRDAAGPIRARLEAGRGSVHALADCPGFIVVPAPKGWMDGMWVNLNRPGDLQAFQEAARVISRTNDASPE
jgi:molybdopterin-guanine dinucleotide biosynthesis protein A